MKILFSIQSNTAKYITFKKFIIGEFLTCGCKEINRELEFMSREGNNQVTCKLAC